MLKVDGIAAKEYADQIYNFVMESINNGSDRYIGFADTKLPVLVKVVPTVYESVHLDIWLGETLVVLTKPIDLSLTSSDAIVLKEQLHQRIARTLNTIVMKDSGASEKLDNLISNPTGETALLSPYGLKVNYHRNEDSCQFLISDGNDKPLYALESASSRSVYLPKPFELRDMVLAHIKETIADTDIDYQMSRTEDLRIREYAATEETPSENS